VLKLLLHRAEGHGRQEDPQRKDVVREGFGQVGTDLFLFQSIEVKRSDDKYYGSSYFISLANKCLQLFRLHPIRARLSVYDFILLPPYF
jgi:hypothetical protein